MRQQCRQELALRLQRQQPRRVAEVGALGGVGQAVAGALEAADALDGEGGAAAV
eukprot:COSAG05_NODE_506_length_9178_cov_36.187576_7_plen_54_part_00